MRAFLPVMILLLAVPATAVETPALLEPDAAATLLAAESDEEWVDGANRLVLLDHETVIVEESGLSHRHRHRFVKVLEPAGALALRSLRFDYDPASNTLELRGLRVHRKDGGFTDLNAEEAIDTTQPTGTINWGARMRVLGLPPLSPGDGVETLTYSKGFLIAYLGEDDQPEGFKPIPAGVAMSLLDSTVTELGGDDDDERYIPPMRGHFYDKVRFAENLPLLEKRYRVSLPESKPLQYSSYNGEVMSRLAFDDGDRLLYEFWRENVPPVKREPRMPDLDDIAPKVVMATTRDWEAKSRWFFETNDWVFESTPEIDAKVAEIIDGLGSDQEKIAALNHWVAQNIRYFGLSMGKGEGYTIHPSEMTFRDRAGVCKDIAGMLVTMLRSAGFETYGAMTMAGARVEQVPADQFNHCVVALKHEDGEFQMLDPTWAPWNNANWSRWEGEQNYVIGTPEGEDLMIIPPFSAEDNLLSVESEARLLQDGTLEGTLRFEGRGIADGRLRGAVANRPTRDLRGYLEGWLGALDPRIELDEFLFSDHRDFTRDTTLRLVYRIPDWTLDLGDALELRSPGLALLARNGSLSRLASIPAGESREHPAFFWAGQRVELKEELQLPRNLDWEEPEAIDLTESQASFRCDWEIQGRKLSLTAALQLDRRTIPAEDFPGLRRVVEAIEERADEPLHASR
jgi:hypothetical protein